MGIAFSEMVFSPPVLNTGEFIIISTDLTSDTIPASAFTGNTKITSVRSPKITTIKQQAFRNCTNLEVIDFPNVVTIEGVTGNDQGAFEDCEKIATADMPKLITLGDRAFCQVTALQSINIPLATYIGAYTFYQCTSLTSITAPNVSTLGIQAFHQCRALTGTLSFPRVTTIGERAFNYCTGISTFNMGSPGHPVTSVNSTAFGWCQQSELVINIYTTGGTVLTSGDLGTTNATINWLQA